MQRIVPFLLGLLIALGVLSASLFVVDQRQFAVVFALGEIKQVIDKPGLHFKLPPPFQNVQYFDKRILTIDTADIDRFITSEKLNVQIDTFVKWRIIDPGLHPSVSGSEVIAPTASAQPARRAEQRDRQAHRCRRDLRTSASSSSTPCAPRSTKTPSRLALRWSTCA
jgi:membrane protease subunit HflC